MNNSISQFYDKAVFETIYLWQNAECKYVETIQNLQISSGIDPKSLESFYKFTNDYSVRRTLTGKGKSPVEAYLKVCNSPNGLFDMMANNSDNLPSIIDKFVEKIRKEPFAAKKDPNSGGKKLISLVSKTAFLRAPKSITMYDSRVVHALNKHKKSKDGNISRIDSYETFYNHFSEAKESYIDKLRQSVTKLLPITNLFPEFKNIENLEDFLVYRSIDKILWFEGGR